MKLLLTAIVFLGLGLTPVRAGEIQLQVPLQCEIGKNCWIQQYADHDPTAGASDFACSSETYDNHDGTDFRVQNTQVDVNVLAAAEGTVKAVRDGMDDRLAITPELLAAVASVECGNGLVITHQGGFETQYCHMKKGSLLVKPGQIVAAGEVLGKVGFSGAAAFPHLHLSVRHGPTKIDPFSGPLTKDCHASATSLWSPLAAEALHYQPFSVMDLGWATGPVSEADLEQGTASGQAPAASWPALVGYAQFINLRKGDSVQISLIGPEGELARNVQIVDHDKAQYIIFAGKRAQSNWDAGTYRIVVDVLRQGLPKFEQTRAAEIK
jgi:hypothetical protein